MNSFDNFLKFEVNKALKEVLNEGRSAHATARMNTIKLMVDFFKSNPDLEPLSDDFETLEKNFRNRCGFIRAFPGVLARLEPVLMYIALNEFKFNTNHQNYGELETLYNIAGYIRRHIDTDAEDIIPRIKDMKVGEVTSDTLENIFGQAAERDDDLNDEKYANDKGEDNFNSLEYLEPIRIETMQQAYKYAQYSGEKHEPTGRYVGQLCFSTNSGSWDLFTSDGKNTCWLLLSTDWDTVPCEHTKCLIPSMPDSYTSNGTTHYTPYDKYGLSMIFVFITPEGKIFRSNTRWNHEADLYRKGNYYTDYALTQSMLSEITHVNFNSLFKYVTPATFEEKLSKLLEKFKNGEDPEDIFDSYEKYSLPQGEFAIVGVKDKYNILNVSTLEFLSKEQWFRMIDNLNDNKFGYFIVYNESNNSTVLKYDGTFVLGDAWFNMIWVMGNCMLYLDTGMGNQILCNSEGKLVEDGLDNVRNNGENTIVTVIDGDNPPDTQKFKLYGKNQELIIGGKNDIIDIDYTKMGCAKIMNYEHYFNYVTIEGKILSPNQWFVSIGDFSEGYAVCKIDTKKYNYLGVNGKTIFPEYISCKRAWSFRSGYARIKIDTDAYNFINTRGEFVSEKNFIDANDFSYGYAPITIDVYKCNVLKMDGTFLSEDYFTNVDSFIRNDYIPSKDKLGALVQKHAKVKGRLCPCYNILLTNGSVLLKKWVISYDNNFKIPFKSHTQALEGYFIENGEPIWGKIDIATGEIGGKSLGFNDVFAHLGD